MYLQHAIFLFARCASGRCLFRFTNIPVSLDVYLVWRSLLLLFLLLPIIPWHYVLFRLWLTEHQSDGYYLFFSVLFAKYARYRAKTQKEKKKDNNSKCTPGICSYLCAPSAARHFHYDQKKFIL